MCEYVCVCVCVCVIEWSREEHVYGYRYFIWERKKIVNYRMLYVGVSLLLDDISGHYLININYMSNQIWRYIFLW